MPGCARRTRSKTCTPNGVRSNCRCSVAQSPVDAVLNAADKLRRCAAPQVRKRSRQGVLQIRWAAGTHTHSHNGCTHTHMHIARTALSAQTGAISSALLHAPRFACAYAQMHTHKPRAYCQRLSAGGRMRLIGRCAALCAQCGMYGRCRWTALPSLSRWRMTIRRRRRALPCYWRQSHRLLRLRADQRSSPVPAD